MPPREEFTEVLKTVGGSLLLPIFSTEEGVTPETALAISQETYGAHQRSGSILSDEQIAAIARLHEFTDFNDLATKSVVSYEVPERQVQRVIDPIVKSGQDSRLKQVECK